MKWNSPLFILFIVLFHTCVVRVDGYGEPDSAGHPNWQERANHVFVNAVRIAPSQYKTVYMAGYSPSVSGILGSSYPARPPVYMEPNLVNSAYFHSNDMATNGCFSHPSCDGTPTFTRIGSFYTCSGTMAENIAAGYSDPLDTNNQFICDNTGSACAADGSGSDGHRANIMSNSYRAIGVGYAYNSAATYRHYWTQDFGGVPCSPAPTSPVYGASHYIKSGQTKFIAVYYTSPAVPPSSASVVISGTPYALSLDIGASGAGTYALSQTSGSACRPYYFTFGSVRYPETGCLVTYGEGGCTTSWDATCGGSSATVASATTKVSTTSTTKAATTKAATSTTKVATATTKSATTTTGSATTGSGGVYYLYSTALQNSWVLQYNSGVGITHSFAYSGRTGLKAVLLTSGSTNFIMFNHVPQVTNVWTSLQFYAATSVNANVLVYFNGGYYQSKALTPTWQLFTIPLTSLANPSTGSPYAAFGSPNQLVFQSAASTGITLYLNNVALI